MDDVVVNNAGYGQLGTLEELTDKEARQNFDINVFGSLNLAKEPIVEYKEARDLEIIHETHIIGNQPGNL